MPAPHDHIEIPNDQVVQWSSTFSTNPGMYGSGPSWAGVYAADLFTDAGYHDVVELGAGQGRDTQALLDAGLSVHALDFSAEAVAQLPDHRLLTATVHDVREPLPIADASVDGVFAHMLFCMALSTPQIEALMGEVHRVLRPGGLVVYTVRHTGDAHYGQGTACGDDTYVNGGFAVHFFDRALVEQLARDFAILDISDFEEGALPRRLWRITQRRR